MSGNRAFWLLIATSAAAQGAVTYLGCCLTMALAWQITHHGVGAGLRSGATWAGATLLALSVAGVVRSVRQLWRGVSATRVIDRQIRAAAVDAPGLTATARQAGLTTRVDMIEDSDRFAFTYGPLRLRTVLSSGFMESATPVELRAVPAHEAEHVRGRDPLRALGVDSLTARYFTLPRLDHLRTAIAADRELAADRCAVAHCGTSAVAGALPKAGDAPRWASVTPAAGMGGRDLLAARITQLEGHPPPRVARPDRLQVALTAVGATLYAWAVTGSAWLIAATPLACMGRGH
ncbi:M56 family metallopeptidase [Streptomyces sp. FXJ1.4098]|nr:M56 family metallopeptidase [Streptomyces sp. FXJ1.4098]